MTMMYDKEMHLAWRNYVGLPRNHQRAFAKVPTTTGKTLLKVCDIEIASRKGFTTYEQLNITTSECPIKKAEDSDILYIQNFLIDVDGKGDPKRIQDFAVRYKDRLAYEGLCSNAQPIELGGGFHLVIPFPKIRNIEQKKTSQALHYIFYMYYKAIFEDVQAHTRMYDLKLDSTYDPSRICSPVGTWRASKQGDYQSLQNGILRTWLYEGSEEYPTREEFTPLHDAILSALEHGKIYRAPKVVQFIPSTRTQTVKQQDVMSELQQELKYGWVKGWIHKYLRERNLVIGQLYSKSTKGGNEVKEEFTRSHAFCKITNALMTWMGEEFTLDCAQIIDEETGDKYGARAEDEVRRILNSYRGEDYSTQLVTTPEKKKRVLVKDQDQIEFLTSWSMQHLIPNPKSFEIHAYSSYTYDCECLGLNILSPKAFTSLLKQLGYETAARHSKRGIVGVEYKRSSVVESFIEEKKVLELA